jgi:hypothetical protein
VLTNAPFHCLSIIDISKKSLLLKATLRLKETCLEIRSD